MPNSGSGLPPTKEKVDRALRRVYIYVGALAGTIFVLLAWILLAILEQSEDNGRTSEANNEIVEALVDCNDPDSACSQRQLAIVREAARVIGSENIDASVAAAWCISRPRINTLDKMHDCVHDAFNQLKFNERRNAQ